MPKLYILFDGADRPSATQLDALARGAKSVRFTEVEIRRNPPVTDAPASEAVDKESLEPEIAKYRVLDSIEKLTESDALVAIVGERGVRPLAETLARAGALTDVVGAVVASTGPAEHVARELASAMVGRGMILISGSDDPETVGARAAKVAGWVRHAKGHEHGDGHGHGHGHRHHH